MLVSAVGDELGKAGISAETGRDESWRRLRTSLPIQAAEQIPIPEDFARNSSPCSPQSRTLSAQKAFADLYLRKTPEEVARNPLGKSGRECWPASVLRESATPDLRRQKLRRQWNRRFIGRSARDGIFHSRGWAMVQSGPNSADAGRFNRSTGRRLEDGDLVLIELATCVNGYWSDLTRTGASRFPEG